LQTPADELGLRPGDVVSTDEGDVVKVRDDGQLEMVRQGPIGLRLRWTTSSTTRKRPSMTTTT
jgi:hypothetical protein